MKKIIALILALVLALSLVACASSPATNEDPSTTDTTPAKTEDIQKEGETRIDTEIKTDESDNKDVKIAFVQTDVHPYYEPMPYALKDIAKNLGIREPDHIILTTAMSAEEWAQQIDTLITRGYDGIVTVVPGDAASEAKAQEVKDAGIALSGVASAGSALDQVDVFWCTNAYNATTTAVTSLCEALGGKGDIIHVTTMAADMNTAERVRAVEDVLKKYPDINLVQTIADVDNTELAQNAVNNFFASGEHIDGILCTGGGCTTGTVAALRQNDRKDLVVVGIDTDDATLAAIRDGYMMGTMYQDAYAQCYFACLTCYKLANGYKFVGDNKIMDSGSALITLDNIDEIESTKQVVRDEILANIDNYFQK